MMTGIEDIQLYTGRMALSISDLAEARGESKRYVLDGLMCDTRSVYPAWEDTVTMAVNAAKPLTDRVGTGDIDLLIVATESAVDFGKPVSTWVHRFCELPAHCRNFELKHACYGGTAALKMAATWVKQSGKKALVISVDSSRTHIGSRMEYICGGCAVAMLVSDQADLLTFDLERAGFWTTEIADTFRPTSRHEIGNDQLSLYSYIDALEGAFHHYENQYGEVDYRNEFSRHIYHVPFPAMAWQAHRTLLARYEEMDKSAKWEDFETRVAPGLLLSRQIGTSYGASNFVCLLSLLSRKEHLNHRDTLSLFAYGSGCQGEFYTAQIGEKAHEKVHPLHLSEMLAQRSSLSVKRYESLEKERQALIDTESANLSRQLAAPLFQQTYQGENLLILNSIENFNRRYEWS